MKLVSVKHSNSRRDLTVFEEEETSLGVSNFPQRIMEAAVLKTDWKNIATIPKLRHDVIFAYFLVGEGASTVECHSRYLTNT